MARSQMHDRAITELSSIPGFTGCTKKQLAMVDRLSDRVDVGPGQVLIREGTMSREAYVIISGSATVTRRGRLVTTLGPGDHFGEMAAIETGRRNATLTTISNFTALAFGPREFSAVVSDVPGFRDVLLRGMVRKLRETDDTLESIQILSGETPAAGVLAASAVA
jgi:CRP/FNR family cyclic AMP-dependent transcriptional regulator